MAQAHAAAQRLQLMASRCVCLDHRCKRCSVVGSVRKQLGRVTARMLSRHPLTPAWWVGPLRKRPMCRVRLPLATAQCPRPQRYVKHRRQKQPEDRHAQHAGEHGDTRSRGAPRGRRHERTAAAEPAMKATGHDDRAQPQTAGLERGFDDAFALLSSSRANSTIRIAFLQARPISTTRPTCMKTLLSPPVSQHAADRRQHAHRHDQDHGQRQRPALVQRRQHQKHQHHGKRKYDERRVALASPAGTSGRSTRFRCRGAASARRSPSSLAMACAGRKHCGIGVADHVRRRIAVVADHRIGAVTSARR